ncbi:hypothetical protein [Noviherbaspirillum autotrophicum]|nr:hypothetical protein [Noviherbaspirillum autotrophicum]
MGMIASNGLPILEARKKGLKPAEMILVSLIGRINEPNHTVYAQPSKVYDWLWVRGLQVCIYAAPSVDWRAVARSIAFERPSFLGVWDADNRQGANVYLLPHPADIDKPQNQWRWMLDFLPWLPFENKEFAWS